MSTHWPICRAILSLPWLSHTRLLLTVYARIKPSLSFRTVLFFTSFPAARWILSAILLLFVLLGGVGITNMGIVGEVAWSLDGGPILWRTMRFHFPHDQWGPLHAATTRPMSSVAIADAHWPLLINIYTGGWADWPARAVAAGI